MATAPYVRLPVTEVSPFLARCDSPLVVSAEITGSPAPSVSWYIGKTPVTDCSRYQLRAVGGVGAAQRTHTLTVSRVGLDMDRQQLIIVAKNQMGIASRCLDLQTYRGSALICIGSSLFDEAKITDFSGVARGD